MRNTALEVNPGLIAICCGSYRRGKPTCGDVDVLITHPDGKSHKGVFSKILTSLKETGKSCFHLLEGCYLAFTYTESHRDFFYTSLKFIAVFILLAGNLNKLLELTFCDVVVDRLK